MPLLPLQQQVSTLPWQTPDEQERSLEESVRGIVLDVDLMHAPVAIDISGIDGGERGRGICRNDQKQAFGNHHASDILSKDFMQKRIIILYRRKWFRALYHQNKQKTHKKRHFASFSGSGQ
jgi:hypothetical protein